MGAIAIHLHHQVRDHVPQLRAIGAEAGEALGEGSDRCAAPMRADSRADQCAILGKAIDDGVHLAGIQGAGVAGEQVADAEAILQRDRAVWTG